MVTLLYLLGYFALLYLLVKIFYSSKLNASLPDKLLVFGTSLIPLGKLLYFPIPGLIGLKFSFIFLMCLTFYWLLIKGVKKSELYLLAILLLPLLSLLYIENHDWILFYQLNEEQSESSLLRLISFVVLVFYSIVIYTAVLRNSRLVQLLSDYFVIGTLLSACIGIFIWINVFTGAITELDLAPLSAGVHIVSLGGGAFYRFNPGANVNEFSMILAYAIFLLPFTTFKVRTKLTIAVFFLVLMLATLTRASWLAFVFACIVFFFIAFKTKRVFFTSLLGAMVFFSIFIVLYGISPEFQYLIDSRMSMDIGASGHERLDKFQYVFDRGTENTFRFLFGFGWATNMYVHNVYLQLLYEIGLLGLIIFVLILGIFTRRVPHVRNRIIKASLYAMLIFMLTVAFMHHNLYHVQTWFVLGFIAAASTVYTRSKSAENVKH